MSGIKIAFISLGCSKNQVDSEKILGMLDLKYQLTNNYNEAEMIFINTCAFIEDAKREAIDTILEMIEYKTKGKCKNLVVLGCLIERYEKEIIKEIPEIDLVIPISNYSQLKKILTNELHIDVICDYGLKRWICENNNSAYLKIADGCDNKCSYCAIPLIRKDYRSTPIDELINEAKELVSKGVKEIVLIAQDTTNYGYDLYGYYALADLLKSLNEIEGLFWIRVLYMYPALLSKELIVDMSELSKVLFYFDLPLQHGSERLLKLMNRRGTIADFKNKIEFIKSFKKPYVLRTTMMVGFPKEKEEDFSDLLELVRESRFHKLGAFIYSKEEDTVAYNLKEEVDKDTAESRYNQLMDLQREISYLRNKELVGQVLEVLIEGKENLVYRGRSLYQSPEGIDGWIWINNKESIKIGEFYQVLITDFDDYDLFGEFISN